MDVERRSAVSPKKDNKTANNPQQPSDSAAHATDQADSILVSIEMFEFE